MLHHNVSKLHTACRLECHVAMGISNSQEQPPQGLGSVLCKACGAPTAHLEINSVMAVLWEEIELVIQRLCVLHLLRQLPTPSIGLPRQTAAAHWHRRLSTASVTL